MKVLFITHPLAFQAPGGGEQIILQSKTSLEEIGAQVDLFDPWTHKVEDYDIIHFFSCLTWWDWKTVKSYKKPLVLTPTSWPAKGGLHKSIELFKDILKSRMGQREAYSLRSYFSYPDLFFPTTSKEKALLGSYYDIPTEKMVVIGNGVVAPKIIEDNENSFIKETSQRGYILFSGSIRPNKNVDILIKACQKLNLKLVVMGESSFNTKDYEAHCKKLAGPETFFTGFVEKSSKRYDEVYSACEMVVIPSDFETFCLSAAEGASIGKPVLVPRSGGTECVFGDRVTYIEDGKSLKNVVESLTIAHKQLLDSSSQLSIHIHDNFSLPSIASKMFKSYSTLL